MKIQPSVSVRDFPVKALKASTQDFMERSCSLSRSDARLQDNLLLVVEYLLR